MNFNNIVGQVKAKKILKLKIDAAKSNGGKFPHLFFAGRSGNGKTTLAQALAGEMDAEMIYINGTVVKDPMQFREYFVNAIKDRHKHYFVFIDEAHCVPRKVQESLLSVLEEPAILCTVTNRDITIQYGNISKYYEKGSIIREKLPANLSFIFASTDKGLINEPLLNRLYVVDIQEYSDHEKALIAKIYLEDKGINNIDLTMCHKLAVRSRSIRHLKSAICDTMADIVTAYKNIDLSLLDEVLDIDEDGISNDDINYLQYLQKNGVVGLANLASYMRKQPEEIQFKIEPHLLSKGLIQINKSGRSLTQLGINKCTKTK